MINIKRIPVLLVACFVLTALVGPSLAAKPVAKSTARIDNHRVISHNIYIGADPDISRLLEIINSNSTLPPEQILFLIAEEVAQFFEEVMATRFPEERAEVIADEYRRRQPHLLGLQEVARFEIPGVITLDYLDILLQALKAQGLDYKVAESGGNQAIVENVDVILPILLSQSNDSPLIGQLQLTDRDVILVRSDVAVSEVISGNYSEPNLLPLPPLPLNLRIEIPSNIERGFTAVKAINRGRLICFVNTHLEGQEDEFPQFQAAQALELVGVIDGFCKDLPISLVGDFNSSPEAEITVINGMSIIPPYLLFTEFVGFKDVWEGHLGPPTPEPTSEEAQQGATCCQDEDLRNEISKLDDRIDLIFVRGISPFVPFSEAGPTVMRLFGDEPTEKTPSGLWPSDHAGVFANMVIRPEDNSPPGRASALTRITTK